MRIERDPQPVPGGETVVVDKEWFEAAMKHGVPFDPRDEGPTHVEQCSDCGAWYDVPCDCPDAP